jgi:exopolysaccharide biosynthesis protein|tara:strand:+ start:173 stop:1108 length:936 start_codon:yes stop_codon:yes gene_type:complete
MTYKYVILFYFGLFSCTSQDEPIENIKLSWKSYRNGIFNSDGIRLFSGGNPEIPLKAFYAEIDLSSPNIDVEVVSGNDDDMKETPSQIADRLDACLVVNGGYFLMDEFPARHVGLLKTKDSTISAPLLSVLRNGKRFYTTRGTVGFRDKIMDISWVSGRNDTLYSFQNSHKNSVNTPPAIIDFNDGFPWEVESAISGGPVLVQNGKIYITDEEEVFFGTKIPEIHPRTAIGYTDKNTMIILVVDGRQASSRGVYLEELAQIMVNLKCVEALNLDGGGSSALVVSDQLINKPSGTSKEREVMSAIVVTCYEN